jgi:tRNA G10  N-methylase Trm11
VNELFSKLKSSEVDRGMTAKIEGLIDSHSLALIGGLKGKSNANPSTRMFSLSSLMSSSNEEFDVHGEDELALLTRRFERMHESWMNSRRNSRACFKCGKAEHFFAECSKVNNHDKHKFKDKRKKSKKKDHGHGKKTRSREKMKRSSDIESDSEDTSSSSSDEDEEDDKKKKKKNLGMYLNDLCVTGLSLKDNFCGTAHSSSSKRS